MSGYNGPVECPNCGNEAGIYKDTKPFTYSEIDCDWCGFQVNPIVSYKSIEQLNHEFKERYDRFYCKEADGEYDPESSQIKIEELPPRLVKDFDDIWRVLKERYESQV